MKNLISINKSILILFLFSVLAETSCKKDFIDPNRATEAQVLSSSKGLTGIAVGLQRVYTLGRASSLYNLVTINGLLTNELFVVNAGNTAEIQLQSGGTAVDGNHAMLTTFWASNNKVIYDANLVIENAKNLSDKSYASGLIAYASIFKALSIGNLSQFWEKVPASIGTAVTFIDRVDGFKKAIAVLDEAQAAISANAISASFVSNVPVGIDIVNTINALKARYYLYSNQLPSALASANLVDVTKKSTFNFDALSLNPIFEVATSTNNVVQPKDSALGLPPELAPAVNDPRVAFYTSINATIGPRFRINGFGNAAATAFPVYLPGEINLIKAEVYTRQNDTTNGKLWLNGIITKTADPFNVFANQPAIAAKTQANLLDQIYRQRCIELYMSGQKLEDMRRFNRPNGERKRNLMPYPLRERDNNSNTPADPSF
ncbi:MAG: RagB/SusD family nutrient uptake outer membrane protein [Saprospiraceae bacterium]